MNAMKDKAKWTLGPWTQHGQSIYAANGVLIGCAYAKFSRELFTKVLTDRDEIAPDVIADSNARLIAAAPELAEALKAVLEVYVPVERDGYSDIGGVTTRARAALRAAGWEGIA